MINIAIIDDQPIVRQGIVELIHINDNFNVVLQASNGEEGLNKIADQAIDIIITDIQMPVLNGIAFLTQLRASGNNTPVLVLTTFDDNELLVEAIKAGCNGFLLKDITLEKLNNAIQAVASGSYLIEPQTSPSVEDVNKQSITLTESITDTEKQILRLAAAGFNNKEIASCIHLADGTIKNYVSKILEKTHSRDRTQAVVKAIQWGII
ncbi:response regulator [Marinibactrum halimedae]|uniref:DNA-binding response regulator n=1 Tax=Marinibactrum halimedae TaxID=1444977 RepID=A0AA37TF20_9GAMM|nr:response regulator transcription factor [Marinibactrum halimedae]MCD9460504.1 response regulator transcription factor [Marinibactrum halimedae]GLS27867.1 DNA-binding response regulator [Marinibactrum halimedae]